MKPCDEPCPKCGGDDVYRHLLIKGKRVHPPNADGYHACACVECGGYAVTKDTIRQHCRTCGWEWEREPLT